MIYNPEHYAVESGETIRQFIREYPFATLITRVPGLDENGLSISHLPLVLRGGRMLVGHLARANGHWKTMASNPEINVIFHGPHTYVSPRFYSDSNDVPTWNYQVVHVHGRVRMIEDPAGLLEILRESAAAFEGGSPQGWGMEQELKAEFRDQLMKRIIGFEIDVVEWQAKFKLSQNRPEEQRKEVASALGDRKDEMSRKIREAMLALANVK